MLKRGIRYIGMFLIYLMILPIFHSANVTAGFNANVHGYDGIPGFRKASGDATIINSSASIEGETILPSQVKLISDPTRHFVCSESNISEDTHCEMAIAGDLPPGRHIYEVQLFYSDMSEAYPKIPLEIYVDALPPTIHSFGIVRNGTDVEAAYRVSDRACDDCPPDICAGIGKIEFLLNYVKVGETIPKNYSCLLPANKTVLAIADTAGTSTKTICIDVYDRLGQKSSECKDIVMDFTPPQLINASLWLGSFPVKYTTGTPLMHVTLKAYFEEESGFNESSLVADFSALTARAEFKEIYKHIAMDDTGRTLFSVDCNNVSDSLYVCEWKDLLVIIPDGVNAEIQLSVMDDLSNKVNTTYTLPITFDNIDPVITGMRSGMADERGRYWVGAGNNTIFVDVFEEGSGMNDGKLLLDVSSFGAQPNYGNKQVLLPNNCTEGWTCVFGLIVVDSVMHTSGDTISAGAIMPSSDDANNPVGGSWVGGFRYDAEAPQIIAIENSSICPTAPGDIAFAVNVSERYSGGVTAEVSAPNLSTNVFPQVVECEETDTVSVWTCDIVIDNLVTYYVDGGINLTLTDRAGNSNTTSIPQEVCEAAPGVPPNVLSVAVDESSFRPYNGIDRKMASQIPYPLFFNLLIDERGGSVQDMKIDFCEIDNSSFSESYFVTPGDFANPLIGSKIHLASFITTTSEDGEFDEDYLPESIDATCQFSFIVRAGNRVYEEPEIEIIDFKIPLYNLPMGYIPKAIADDIDDLNDEIADLGDTIESMDKWNDALGTICTLGELMAQLVVLTQALKAVLLVVGLINNNGESWYPDACDGIDKISDFIIKWVFNPYLSSKKVSNTGWWLRVFCTFYTCEVSESGNFIDSVIYNGNTAGNTYRYTYDGDETQSKPTVTSQIPIVSIFADYDYSVYKSIDVAWGFLCVPGILYNYKKDRQIKCLYRSCLQDRAAAGLSTAECDELYNIRECVYVESAALKGFGWNEFAMWLQGIATWGSTFTGQWALHKFVSKNALHCTWANENTDSTSRTSRSAHWCGKGAQGLEGSSTDTSWKTGKDVACGVILAVSMWLEVSDMIGMYKEFDWNKYDKDLGDPDFCG